MDRIKGKIVPAENIGLTDRMLRFFGGGALLAGGALYIVITGSATIWPVVAILVAVYPLMTTVMGWDPFYQLMGARTCHLAEGSGQCGTFPYQVDAALGHNPTPARGFEYDRSLEGAHSETERKAAA